MDAPNGVILAVGVQMSDINELTTREDIERLQLVMQLCKTKMPEAIHHFAPGVYCREFTLPALNVVVGKRHKHAHFMVVLKGKAFIYTEGTEDLMEAGNVFLSLPGAKRVVLALEDTTFLTFHANPSNTTDIAEIENDHIEPESPEYLEAERKLNDKLAELGVV